MRDPLEETLSLVPKGRRSKRSIWMSWHNHLSADGIMKAIMVKRREGAELMEKTESRTNVSPFTVTDNEVLQHRPRI